jgi:hypothetical protein
MGLLNVPDPKETAAALVLLNVTFEEPTMVVQATATLVTFALATVPLPLLTTQVCVGPEGWVRAVTA